MSEQHVVIELEKALAEYRKLNAEHAKLLAAQRAAPLAVPIDVTAWTAWWQPVVAGALFVFGTAALTVIVLKYLVGFA